MPAESTSSFFRSKLGLDCCRNSYFRFAKMSVNPNSSPARSRDTVNRSSVMVTEASELSSIFFLTGVNRVVGNTIHRRAKTSSKHKKRGKVSAQGSGGGSGRTIPLFLLECMLLDCYDGT